MQVIGINSVANQALEPHHQYKLVLNENGLIFFPATVEHRSQKADGLSYEDDYRGNALAALVNDGRVEIRFHRDFDIRRVMQLVARIRSLPELSSLNLREFTYQGKRLD